MKPSTNHSRRDLLKILASAPIAASAVTMAPAIAQAPKANTTGQGYRETEHVRRYYATLRDE